MSVPEREPKAITARAHPLPKRYDEIAPQMPEAGLNLVEVFDETADIEMEIGFGRGMFVVQRAQAIDGLQLLGFEIKRKWAYRVAERCKRLALPHVRVMAGDVRETLPQVRPDRVVARVFVHFPDPWWKKRHAKRRLASSEVLDQIARLLRPGGEFFVQTDVEERAREFRDALDAHPDFELGGESGYLDHNPYQARSNREQRALEDGLPVFRVLGLRRP